MSDSKRPTVPTDLVRDLDEYLREEHGEFIVRLSFRDKLELLLEDVQESEQEDTSEQQTTTVDGAQVTRPGTSQRRQL